MNRQCVLYVLYRMCCERSLSQEWNGRSDRQYVLSTYCSVTSGHSCWQPSILCDFYPFHHWQHHSLAVHIEILSTCCQWDHESSCADNLCNDSHVHSTATHVSTAQLTLDAAQRLDKAIINTVLRMTDSVQLLPPEGSEMMQQNLNRLFLSVRLGGGGMMFSAHIARSAYTGSLHAPVFYHWWQQIRDCPSHCQHGRIPGFCRLPAWFRCWLYRRRLVTFSARYRAGFHPKLHHAALHQQTPTEATIRRQGINNCTSPDSTENLFQDFPRHFSNRHWYTT